MSDIHVLHVLNSTSGGSAISTLELIIELKRHGVKSSLLCFRNGSKELRKKINERVEGRALFIPLYWMNKKIRAKWWKRPAIEVMSIWQTWFGNKYLSTIENFAKINNVNIIHTSTILNPEGAILSKKLNIPHIWHCRELIGPGKPYRFYRFKKWLNWLDVNSDHIVANSLLTFHELIQYFPKQKLSLINNGVEITDFKVKKHNPEKSIIVGMIGNLTTRWKNHLFFIKIAKEVLRVNNNAIFHIYGKIPDINDNYHNQILNKIEENSRIKLMGFVKTQDALKEMDIMFHPTKYESFGRVIIEAMASGITVIALDEGGQSTIIENGKTGYLFNELEENKIAQKIIELAGNPSLRSQIGIQGRRVVEEKYNLKTNTLDLVDIYKTFLN